MISLYLALYSEGVTDDKFLSRIIERTVEELLHTSTDEEVDPMPLFLVDRYVKKESSGAEKILEAARIAHAHDLLIVHSDTDAQKHAEVLETRFNPGYELIKKASITEKVCGRLVPLVPDRMMEAWMLADLATVLDILSADMKQSALKAELKKRNINLPSKPHQVSTIPDPKYVLQQIVDIVGVRKRRNGLDDLYYQLGNEIRLESLRTVDAYQSFVEDLTSAIRSLGKINI